MFKLELVKADVAGLFGLTLFLVRCLFWFVLLMLDVHLDVIFEYDAFLRDFLITLPVFASNKAYLLFLDEVYVVWCGLLILGRPRRGSIMRVCGGF